MRLKLDKISARGGKKWKIFGVLLFLSLIFFSNSLNNYFLSDDWHWLYLAREINWSWQIFVTNYEGGTLGGSYNPLTFLFFKTAYSIFGLHSWYYHLISLIVHLSNAFLVFILAQKVFSFTKLKKVRNWSFLAAILFLLWPTQVEAVNWIAVWPHLWCVTGYLLTFIYYLNWREKNQLKYFWLSLLFFILALGIKEIALSLPLVIILWEAYFYSLGKKLTQKIYSSFYWLILAGFLAVRYLATQMVFGYYGRQSLGWPILEWLGNLAGFVSELFTFGYLRELFYKIWYYHLESLVIILLVGLATYFWYTFWRRKWTEFVIAASSLLMLIPMMPLGLHRFTMADERYVYLASSFFLIWLIIEANNLFKKTKTKIIFFSLIILIIIPTVYHKNKIWQAAGDLAQQIVNSWSQLEVNNKELVSVGLPDNLAGAQVFRNNLQQALELTYPDYNYQIKHLPIYTFVNLDNYNDKLLKWRQDEIGYFAESVDGSFVVTGQTSIVVEDIYFELWNYNYQNYTANIIRLLPAKDQDVTWLTFNQGRLELIYPVQ